MVITLMQLGTLQIYANGTQGGPCCNGDVNTSIFAPHRMVAGEFNAISDARIKTIEGISNSKNDLEILNKIEVTDYHMIDKSHGDKPIKKVIAQQVEEFYPQAVSKTTNRIPDIYKLTRKKVDQSENGFEIGRSCLADLQQQRRTATAVISVNENEFQVDLSKSGSVFVYGREVEDFRTVDYEAISMLNVSATQELLKRIEALGGSKQCIESSEFGAYETQK